jgi:hypothetical protein
MFIPVLCLASSYILGMILFYSDLLFIFFDQCVELAVSDFGFILTSHEILKYFSVLMPACISFAKVSVVNIMLFKLRSD